MQVERTFDAPEAGTDNTPKPAYQAPQLVVLDQIADKTASGFPGGPETTGSVS